MESNWFVQTKHLLLMHFDTLKVAHVQPRPMTYQKEQRCVPVVPAASRTTHTLYDHQQP